MVGDFRQLLPVKAAPPSDYGFELTHSLAFEPATFKVSNRTGTAVDEVAYGSILSDGPFADGDPKARAWKTAVVSLLTNHRQSKGEGEAGHFINALNAIGDGRDFTDPEVQFLLSRVWVKDESGVYRNYRTGEELPSLKKAIHLFKANRDVAAHNKAVIDELKAQPGSIIKTYKADVRSRVWNDKQILQAVDPIPGSNELVVGMRFMVRVNLTKRLVNGTVGEVAALEDDRILLRMDDGSEEWLNYSEHPLPEAADGLPVGTFRTAAMGHGAHALTYWKIQGITVAKQADAVDGSDCVAVHLSKGWPTHGLLYVACSRVQEVNQLFLLVDDLGRLNREIKCDPEVKAFISTAEARMKELLGVEESHPEDELTPVKVEVPTPEAAVEVSTEPAPPTEVPKLTFKLVKTVKDSIWDRVVHTLEVNGRGLLIVYYDKGQPVSFEVEIDGNKQSYKPDEVSLAAIVSYINSQGLVTRVNVTEEEEFIVDASGKGLAAALSLETGLAYREGRVKRNYEVEVDGHVYADAAAAIKAGLDAGQPLKAVATKVIGLKFFQHEALAEKIHELGGADYLLSIEYEVSEESVLSAEELKTYLARGWVYSCALVEAQEL